MAARGSASPAAACAACAAHLHVLVAARGPHRQRLCQLLRRHALHLGRLTADTRRGRGPGRVRGMAGHKVAGTAAHAPAVLLPTVNSRQPNTGAAVIASVAARLRQAGNVRSRHGTRAAEPRRQAARRSGGALTARPSLGRDAHRSASRIRLAPPVAWQTPPPQTPAPSGRAISSPGRRRCCKAGRPAPGRVVGRWPGRPCPGRGVRGRAACGGPPSRICSSVCNPCNTGKCGEAGWGWTRAGRRCRRYGLMRHGCQEAGRAALGA